MSDITRYGMGARLSEAAIFNGVVYLAGMVPEGGAADIAGQTADVLAQIDAHLIRRQAHAVGGVHGLVHVGDQGG